MSRNPIRLPVSFLAALDAGAIGLALCRSPLYGAETAGIIAQAVIDSPKAGIATIGHRSPALLR